MTIKMVQEGTVIQYTNSGSALSSGDPVRIGKLIGICLVDIANGATGSVAISGVFTVPKTSGTAWVQGDSIDWDASASEFHKGVVPAAGDLEDCAVAFSAATSGATTADVLLNTGGSTVV